MYDYVLINDGNMLCKLEYVYYMHEIDTKTKYEVKCKSFNI